MKALLLTIYLLIVIGFLWLINNNILDVALDVFVANSHLLDIKDTVLATQQTIAEQHKNYGNRSRDM